MLITRHKKHTDSRGPELKRSTDAGFTLVELLVVIALITILLAIFVPVMVQSRNRARSAACLSNLRQLSSALITYSQDWDDKLPSLTATPFAGSAPSNEWPQGSSATQLRAVLSSYVKNSGVYKCGNDCGSPEYAYGASEGSVFSRAGSSYLPWSAARSGRYGVAINGAKTGALSHMSEHALIRDYGSDWHGFRTRSGLDVEALTVANAAFADGHCASVPVFTASASDRRYSCWATSKDGNSGSVFISGGSGVVQVELSGTRNSSAESAGQIETRLSLSGTVIGGGSVHIVDRVFVLGADTRLDAAFRQVIAWADGLVSR
ncbi:MAG: type II secretion system protein [Armatimonadota bacterium]